MYSPLINLLIDSVMIPYKSLRVTSTEPSFFLMSPIRSRKVSTSGLVPSACKNVSVPPEAVASADTWNSVVTFPPTGLRISFTACSAVINDT